MSVDYFKSVLDELEKVHEKLDRLLASEKGIYHLESTTGKREDWVEKPKKEPTVIETTETEEVSQDLTQVLLWKETDKAFLAVKNVYQVWIAKSHLEDAEGYDLGNTYDLKLKEKSKWVLKKLDWKPFEVFKS